MIIDKIAEKFVKEAFEKKIFKVVDLQKLKNEYSAKYKIRNLLNRDLVKVYKKFIQDKIFEKSEVFESLIRKRGIRTESGIASVTIVTKPYACPGKCIFCPTEKNVPKSYASNEPGIMRAILNDYDPYRQVVNRLNGYIGNGHSADKVEMIILGGTFSFYPHRYQTDFIRRMFNALNKGVIVETHNSSLLKSRWETLCGAQRTNETAEHRCVGLSVETRPDYISSIELKRFRKLGITRIEMGVQSTFDSVLKLNKRGHDIAEVKRAMKLMKDAGFKITSHLMPNLPGSNLEMDFQVFKDIFDDPDLKTDWLKIYPCSVVPFSELADLWKQGKHEVYKQEDLINLLISVKQIVPKYIRITRFIRDIPDGSILAGATVSNLRQELQKRIKENPKKYHDCECIRCREIRDLKPSAQFLKLNCLEYLAQGGKEFFLSIDDESKNKLCANLRLRFPSQFFENKKHFMKELEGCALIRELHVFGSQIALGEKKEKASQHLGFGSQLMSKAEEIAKKAGFKKIAVISGIGVREYYRKLGYELEGTYMIKKL
ncbi:hypothetical protein A2335_03335 [Candidatus Peregrinibacteria bacterium RIFOXYB2_FULL_32_7]|nr:MAG: hypothetical protein A2335_03335 [Candidatus Peregrinibacteria bacterium RIFOXYB2_FULL_32_7]